MSAGSDREPTRRFSSRVDDYVRHRPGYPSAVLDHLRRRCGLDPACVVADVGSGTGLWTRVLLDNENPVFAIEPNREMREAAERLLAGAPNFKSVEGSAEATGLPPRSVDFVTAAQAFHWFRIEEARREFERILVPRGRIALIWNRRKTEGAFLAAYENLLSRFAIDYGEVDHRRTTDSKVLDRFFGSSGYTTATFANRQALDWEGVRGRLLSSSYAPLPGHPRHDAMMRELRRAFDGCRERSTVTIEYDTEVYCGRID